MVITLKISLAIQSYRIAFPKRIIYVPKSRRTEIFQINYSLHTCTSSLFCPSYPISLGLTLPHANSEAAEKIPHWHQCHSSPCTPCHSPVPLPWTPWEEHALLRAPSRFWGPEKGIDGFGQKNKLGKVRRAYHIQFRKGVKKQDVELRTFFSPSTAEVYPSNGTAGLFPKSAAMCARTTHQYISRRPCACGTFRAPLYKILISSHSHYCLIYLLYLLHSSYNWLAQYQLQVSESFT